MTNNSTNFVATRYRAVVCAILDCHTARAITYNSAKAKNITTVFLNYRGIVCAILN